MKMLIRPKRDTNHFDAAVQIEVEVEGVLVVGDGTDEGQHQAAVPAHLGHSSAPIRVFPRHSAVFLMHANLNTMHI